MKSIHTPQYIAFTKRLKAIRLELGVSQEELASRLDKPQSYISKVELAERRLDLVEYTDWMQALGADAFDPLRLLCQPQAAASGSRPRRRLKLKAHTP